MKIEEIQERKKLELEISKQIEKDIQDMKEIINQFALTPNGLFALRVLNKLLFANLDNNDVNPNILAFEKGQRFIYNKLFFEILKPEVSKEVIFNNK